MWSKVVYKIWLKYPAQQICSEFYIFWSRFSFQRPDEDNLKHFGLVLYYTRVYINCLLCWHIFRPKIVLHVLFCGCLADHPFSLSCPILKIFQCVWSTWCPVVQFRKSFNLPKRCCGLNVKANLNFFDVPYFFLVLAVRKKMRHSKFVQKTRDAVLISFWYNDWCIVYSFASEMDIS